MKRPRIYVGMWSHGNSLSTWDFCCYSTHGIEYALAGETEGMMEQSCHAENSRSSHDDGGGHRNAAVRAANHCRELQQRPLGQGGKLFQFHELTIVFAFLRRLTGIRDNRSRQLLAAKTCWTLGSVYLLRSAAKSQHSAFPSSTLVENLLGKYFLGRKSRPLLLVYPSSHFNREIGGERLSKGLSGRPSSRLHKRPADFPRAFADRGR